MLFEPEQQWQAIRDLPTVRAALDGRAGPGQRPAHLPRPGAGGEDARTPRWPKPAHSASAVSCPEPLAEPHLDLTGTSPPDLAEAVMAGSPAP